MLKLISVLYTTGCRGVDVCDVIFEGGPGKCDKGGNGVIFFLKSRDVIYRRPLYTYINLYSPEYFGRKPPNTQRQTDN